MSRRLRPDERALWDQVAKSATPLHEKPRLQDVLPPVQEAPEAVAPKPSAVRLQPFDIGSKAKTDTRVPRQSKDAPKMDAKSFSKLKKGRLEPEGRIDLHGMTTAEAHPELVNFILRSHHKGRRLVLVITGKGDGPGGPSGPLPYQRGILRRQVPHWLQQAPIGTLILQMTPASPRHGGNGALYVYLRRAKRR
ncbi:MAG: Smr/MutS family protein [Pseudomonadota bacterium]